MTFSVFTIVLDGMPWITKHLEQLQATNLDWRWVIVEGVARPTKDTSWVRGIPPRLSIDGTTEYLDSIKDKRVKVIRNARWENKTSMCNAALREINSGILLQMDSDECWTARQHQDLHDFFINNPQYDHARFWCNYYLGKDIVATSYDGYGNRASEWVRAWRFRKGDRFLKHEPPTLTSQHNGADRDLTRAHGLVFDHFSWVDEDQVKAKCLYYGGNYSYEAWKNLQNAEFPVVLSDYLPWVGPNSYADKVVANQPVLGRRQGPDEGAIAAHLRLARVAAQRRHPTISTQGHPIEQAGGV